MGSSLKLRSFEPKEYEKCNHRCNTGNDQRCLTCGKIIALHCEEVTYHFNIGKAERRYAFCKNAAINRAEKQPQHRDHSTQQCTPLYCIDKHQRCKYDQRIVQKYKIAINHKAARR